MGRIRTSKMIHLCPKMVTHFLAHRLWSASLRVVFVVIVSQSAAAQEEGMSHPDFFSQWEAMKRANLEVLPSGLYQQWLKYDQAILDRRPKATPLFPSAVYLGPEHIGGRTRALCIDRDDPDHILAGGISGGLWQSYDRGATWSAVNDQQLNLAVSSIVQSPFDHRVFYYCTGEARANSAHVQGNGVFETVNGGGSFNHLSSTASASGFSECWCIDHSRTLKATLFVGTEEKGLLRSDDGGKHWAVVLPNRSVTDIACLPSGGIFASASEDGLYYSPDGKPGTFKKIKHAHFPADFQRVEIEVSESDSDVIYAAFESTKALHDTIGFFRSADGGKTWESRTCPRTEASMNRYTFVLAVHPTHCDRVFCGGAKGEYSLDGGNTWDRVKNSHNDFHVLASFPDDPDSFIVGTDGGLYRYDWSTIKTDAVRINRGYHVTQFYAGDYAPSGDIVVGGTQDNGTLRLSGTAQKRVCSADGAFCHIGRADPDIAYVSQQNAVIFRSENFSSADPDWSPINFKDAMRSEGFQFLNPYHVNSQDARQLYCRTNQALWRSTDNGAHWRRLTDGKVEEIFAITCSSESNPTVYFGGKQGSFFRIKNAKTAKQGTEDDLSSSVPASVANDYFGAIEVHPTLAQTVFVCFLNVSSEPRVWRVNCATTPPTWTKVSGDLPKDLPVNYIQFDPLAPQTKWVAATDFGLYYTRNAGTNWDKEEAIPNVSIHQIKMRSHDRTLFVFTHGRGIWKLK